MNSLAAADPSRWLRDWSDALSAFGTLGAVLFALWFQVYREWRRKPILDAAFSTDVVGDRAAVVETDESIELWLRVRVRNRPGRDTAEKAQVTLLGVLREDEQGSWAHIPERVYPSRNLKWSDVTTTEILMPGATWKYFDLAYTIFNKKTGVTAGTLIALWPVDDVWQEQSGAPAGMRNLLPSNQKYKLIFAMSAINAPPRFAAATVLLKDPKFSIDDLLDPTKRNRLRDAAAVVCVEGISRSELGRCI